MLITSKQEHSVISLFKHPYHKLLSVSNLRCLFKQPEQYDIGTFSRCITIYTENLETPPR